MTLTDWLIIGLYVLIGGSDVILMLRGRQTYSARKKRWFRKVAFVPWSWGVFAGHWGGPTLPWVAGSAWISISVLTGVGVALTGVHKLWAWYIDTTPPWWSFIVYLAIGVPCGMLLWPQG